MPTKLISIRIDTELLDRLTARAAKEHRTLSNMIKAILTDITEGKIREQIEEINGIVENDVHQAVSPENWHIYSNLHDALAELESLLMQVNVI